MKLSTLAVVANASLLALFTLAGCSGSEAPTEDHHAASNVHADHTNHAEQSAALTPPEGELWATDEPLRQAMTRVRAAVAEALPAHESGSFDPASALALAQTIEREVAFMIEHCKLPPEPDAALHVLIARMLTAANGLKSAPPAADAIPELTHVLEEYGTNFDHPDWAPLGQAA